MIDKVHVAGVRLWGKDVGAVSWDTQREISFFEFESAFLKTGINISPYLIEYGQTEILSYPDINKDTYKGLPGFLADTLPDDFGNAIIDAWLARLGRSKSDFSPVERLCYTGTRGMGALEFYPVISKNIERGIPVEIDELVTLASKVLSDRDSFIVTVGENDTGKEHALKELLSIGTSAGGQRPKAVLAINPKTKQILSGQIQAPQGYEYWLLKFDGVTNLYSQGVIADPQGYGNIEYAYYLMAKACNIHMMESKLYKENGRSHFMTKRFDRTNNGDKIHMLSLCGMAHFDYKRPGFYSYEQAFQVMRKQGLDHEQVKQQYRRMVFNIIARNQDDHTKHIAFLMNADGNWKLSPAFDVIYSYNHHGEWTNTHQMTVNGKIDNYTKKDLIAVGKQISINTPNLIIDEIIEIVSQFGTFAHQAHVEEKRIKEIQRNLRLQI